MEHARRLTPEQRASRRAAHRAVLGSHSGAQAEMFARRQAAALTGAAIGLQGRATRAEIRRVARRSSRLVLYYDRLWSESETWEPFVIAGREHLDAALARGRGVIFVPSHFGRYRWVPLTLLELRLPVTLLVDERNHDLIEADVDARIDAMHHHLRPDIFATVESGDPSALWQLARALKGGSVTVMFADGNSGIDGQASPRGAQVIPFLGQSIYARPGIGALAATTDAPVVPIFCHERRDGRPILRFDPPILRAEGERRSVYRERVMLELFATLEREILAQPWLWEEWWILPRWLAADPICARRAAAGSASAEAPAAPFGPRRSAAGSRSAAPSAARGMAPGAVTVTGPRSPPGARPRCGAPGRSRSDRAAARRAR